MQKIDHSELYDERMLEPWSPRASVFEPMISDSIKSLNYTIALHEKYIIQSESSQDWATTVITSNNTPAVVVLDGHGKGDVISFLKQVCWDKLLDYPNIIKILRSQLNENIKNLSRDGSTYASVEAISSGFRCRWMGDTEIIIYHNGSIYWRSQKHTTDSISEKQRLTQLGVPIIPSYSLSAIDEATITMEPQSKCIWDEKKKDITAPTRVLGHTFKANLMDEETYVVKFNKPGKWRAVVFTDGVGDVSCYNDIKLFGSNSYNSEKIAKHALSRWNQDWIYVHPNNCTCIACKANPSSHMKEPKPSKIRGSIDDIAVAILDLDIAYTNK